MLYLLLPILFFGCREKHLVEPKASPKMISSVNKYRRVLQANQRQYHTKSLRSGECPPNEFEINGKTETLNKTVFAEGTATLLYRTVDEKYIVKVVEAQQIKLIENVWREKAAASILGALEHFPQFYQTSAPLSCETRMNTMDYAGDKTLWDFFPGPNYVKDIASAEARSVAYQAISMLRIVHEHGIVHGDVHGGNFVFSDIKKIHLVDFGRSTEWLDPRTGLHMTLLDARLKEQLEKTNLLNADIAFNYIYLSVFELEHYPRSRRDDLYRLAELLCNLLEPGQIGSVYYPLGHDHPTKTQMAQRKRNRQMSSTVPYMFSKFYKDTLALGFDEMPNYDEYLSMFK